jgi:hypothetical protein
MPSQITLSLSIGGPANRQVTFTQDLRNTADCDCHLEGWVLKARIRYCKGSMPDRLSIHEPVLIDTIGHCAGAIVFGILLYFFAVNWMRAGERSEVYRRLF